MKTNNQTQNMGNVRDFKNNINAIICKILKTADKQR